ncbi:hypothetical protein CsatB_030321 [Cannabis sativa]
MCTFLGYSIKHKGYKCLSPTGRIYISRDVLFNEHLFPYATHSLPTSNSSMSTSSSGTGVSAFIPQSTTPFHTSYTHSPPLSSSSSTHPTPHSPPVTDFTSVAPVSQPIETTVAAAASVTAATVSQPHSAPVTNVPTNVHPMVTRAKAGITKPRVLLTTSEPKSYKVALQHPQWNKAMNCEMYALKKNGTWTLVPLPPGKRAITCKWVYKEKLNPDGTTAKYKARLVARGFLQQYGFDFTETFSPVVKPATIKIVLTIALTYKWTIRQLDVNNAFLNGDLQEEVYMAQPPGFVDNEHPHFVCKLHKAIYGLRQAPRAWFEKLKHVLLSFGFLCAKADPSLFYRHTSAHSTFLLVYVDDILVTGSSSSALSSLIQQLHQMFALKDLGLVNYFLGIEVAHTTEGLHLCQKKYILDLLVKAKMDNANSLPTPMTGGEKLSALNGDPFHDPHFYRSVVGALQYATITRPEISYAVNRVSQFMQAPLDSHWKTVKKILRYLSGTIDLGLHLKSASTLTVTGFCDADWASDPDDRRSTSGFCIYLGPNIVSWSSKKQKTVSRSSSEAEYRSLANATADLVWIQALLTEIGIHLQHVPVIWCDNQSAVLMAANPIMHSRTKHIELDLYFVRERVINKQLLVKHTPACDQIADILTKALANTRFLYLRDKLSLDFLSRLSLRGGC